MTFRERNKGKLGSSESHQQLANSCKKISIVNIFCDLNFQLKNQTDRTALSSSNTLLYRSKNRLVGEEISPLGSAVLKG